MWIKYQINDFKHPVGFKVNTETDKVVLGGSDKYLDKMFDILRIYFNKDKLKPIKTNIGKSKFVFDMKYQLVFASVRKMRKELIIQKVDKLGRIYR